jgi:hypothetical protein
MGNNFVCENYYCQSVAFKPEWLSETAWNITYNYDKEIKPYIIDKGVLKINNVNKFDILLSKKLLIDLNEINTISIPINYKYKLLNNNDIDLFIIFSDKLLSLDILNNSFGSINLNLTKNKLYIYRTFNNDSKKINIKSNKINTIDINIENNFELLLITEKIINSYKKNLFESKYLNAFNKKNSFYLSLYIKNKKGLDKNEFIELNFE